MTFLLLVRVLDSGKMTTITETDKIVTEMKMKSVSKVIKYSITEMIMWDFASNGHEAPPFIYLALATPTRLWMVWCRA